MRLKKELGAIRTLLELSVGNEACYQLLVGMMGRSSTQAALVYLAHSGDKNALSFLRDNDGYLDVDAMKAAFPLTTPENVQSLLKLSFKGNKAALSIMNDAYAYQADELHALPVTVSCQALVAVAYKYRVARGLYGHSEHMMALQKICDEFEVGQESLTPSQVRRLHAIGWQTHPGASMYSLQREVQQLLPTDVDHYVEFLAQHTSDKSYGLYVRQIPTLFPKAEWVDACFRNARWQVLCDVMTHLPEQDQLMVVHHLGFLILKSGYSRELLLQMRSLMRSPALGATDAVKDQMQEWIYYAEQYVENHHPIEFELRNLLAAARTCAVDFRWHYFQRATRLLTDLESVSALSKRLMGEMSCVTHDCKPTEDPAYRYYRLAAFDGDVVALDALGSVSKRTTDSLQISAAEGNAAAAAVLHRRALCGVAGIDAKAVLALSYCHALGQAVPKDPEYACYILCESNVIDNTELVEAYRCGNQQDPKSRFFLKRKTTQVADKEDVELALRQNCSVHLLNLGVDNTGVIVRGQALKGGAYSSWAYGILVDHVSDFLRSPEGSDERYALSPQDAYALERDLRNGRVKEAGYTPISAISLNARLQRGEAVTMASGWDTEGGGHAIAFALKKIGGKIYLMYANRGDRARGVAGGIRVFRVDRPEGLHDPKVLERLLSSRHSRRYLEDLALYGDGLGKDLLLTPVVTLGKSDQKIGSCAVAGFHSEVLMLKVFQHLSAYESTRSGLAVSDFESAFESAQPWYKAYRDFSRLASGKAIVELGDPSNTHHLSPGEHQPILAQLIKGVQSRRHKRSAEERMRFVRPVVDFLATRSLKRAEHIEPDPHEAAAVATCRV